MTSQDLRVAFMPDSSSVPTLVGMRTTATFLAQPLVAASVPGGRIGPTIAALVGLAAVVLGWKTFHGIKIPSPSTILWRNQKVPWSEWHIEDVAYNVDVGEYIRARGL